MSDKLENDILNLLHSAAKGRDSTPSIDVESDLSVNEELEDETEVVRIIDQIMYKIGYRDVRTKHMSLIDKLHALDDFVSESEAPTRDSS